MKNISFTWLAPAALLVLGSLAALPACDVIENPMPLQVTVSAGRRDTLALDSAETARPAPTLVQNVLIEDYTGQYCGNCPRAAHMADSMSRKYPGRVVVTEVHVTDYFASPKPPHFPIDFRVPDYTKPLPNTGVSDDINTRFGLENRGLPQGSVNRAPFAAANNDVVATFSLWPAVVAEQLAQTPTVALRLTPLYNRATRLLRLKVSTQYQVAMPGRSLQLGIVLVEDSLIGAQKDYSLNRTQFPDQTVEFYKHHNVMRAALAGTFGSAQVTGPTAGQKLSTYIGYQLPATTPLWNDRKCSVFAYVADADTRKVLQVAMVKLP